MRLAFRSRGTGGSSGNEGTRCSGRSSEEGGSVWLDLLLICCWLLFGLVLESPRINCVKLKRRVHFVSCKLFVDENTVRFSDFLIRS